MDKIKNFPFRGILVSGGGGYLGSKLAESLAGTETEIFLLDLVFRDASKNLASENRHIHLIKADLTDSLQLADICHSLPVDYVFHLAAAIDRNRDFCIYENLQQVNVKATFNLLEALKDVPYKAFVFASTSEVYGTMNAVPFSETMIPEAASPYSLTKLQAEELIRTYSAINKKPWTICRIFNFFGPGMPENTFLPQLIKAYQKKETFHMSQGEQKRDYLHVNEVVSCLLNLAVNQDSMREIINICSGKSYSMKQIAEHYQLFSQGDFRVKHDLPYRENELWDNTGSNEKLQKLIPGFKPIPFLQGLNKPDSLE